MISSMQAIKYRRKKKDKEKRKKKNKKKKKDINNINTRISRD